MILQLRHKVLQLPPSGKAPQSAPHEGLSLLQRKFLQKMFHYVSFLKLLPTFAMQITSYHYYPANEVKQKTRLAVYGRRYRKGREHFVSEMWFATLRTAFLLINCKN